MDGTIARHKKRDESGGDPEAATTKASVDCAQRTIPGNTWSVGIIDLDFCLLQVAQVKNHRLSALSPEHHDCLFPCQPKGFDTGHGIILSPHLICPSNLDSNLVFAPGKLDQHSRGIIAGKCPVHIN